MRRGFFDVDDVVDAAMGIFFLAMGAAGIGIGVKLVFPFGKPAAALTYYQEETGVDGRRGVSMYFYADGVGSFIAFDNAENAAGFVRLLAEKYRVVNLSAFPAETERGRKE